MNRTVVLAAPILAVGLIVPVGMTGANADLSPIPAVPVVDGVPLCGTVGTGDGSNDGVLKVSSFNVLHSDTDDGDLSLGDRLELEADDIVASGADVVGMQEVTRNAVFDPGGEYPQEHGTVAERFATELSGRTGSAWHWCFFRSNPHVPGTPDIQEGGGNPLDDLAAAFGNFPGPGDFSEGIAIVSRFPIEESRSHRLLPRSYESPACTPADPTDIPGTLGGLQDQLLGCNLAGVFDSRQVLWARIGAPVSQGGDIDVFNTHIAHGITALSNTTKLLQVHQILQWIELWSDPATPDFLTGDFNSSPDTDRIKAVTDAGFVDSYAAAGEPECNASTGVGCTGNPPAGEEVWTATNQRTMGSRIDYVFSRNGCTPTASEIIGDVATQVSPTEWLWPSDHLGVSSTFTC